MTVLGAIADLDDNLRIPNLKKLAVRAGSVRHLLDGGYVDQSLVIVAGVELQLQAYMEGDYLYGSFTGAQIDAINALRASREKVDFTHHTGQWRVKVLDVEVEPVFRRSDPDGDDLYIGTITLLIV
jgi:hypothetical protein